MAILTGLWTWKRMKHTIEQVKIIDYKLIDFHRDALRKMNKVFGDKYNVENMDLEKYVRENRYMICLKDGEIAGIMLSRMFSSVFDPTVTILMQDLLYAETPKATSMLLKDYIDFGKGNADHILTTITPQTNIKPRSLERLGFKHMETLYRMETKL